MIASIGLSGFKYWPNEYGGREFVDWAITNFIDDVRLVSEHQLPDE